MVGAVREVCVCLCEAHRRSSTSYPEQFASAFVVSYASNVLGCGTLLLGPRAHSQQRLVQRHNLVHQHAGRAAVCAYTIDGSSSGASLQQQPDDRDAAILSSNVQWRLTGGLLTPQQKVVGQQSVWQRRATQALLTVATKFGSA